MGGLRAAHLLIATRELCMGVILSEAKDPYG